MPQTAKARATAKRIADVAAELFARNGYPATTIANVGSEAGVAPGTVMLHFGSKSQLATAAFADQIRAVVNDARPNARGATLTDDLADFVRPIYAWYASHASFAPDLLREALFSDGPWAAHYANTVRNTVETFASIIASHGNGGSSIELIAEGLLADYLLVLFQGLRGTFDSVEAQLAHFLDLASTRLHP